MPPPAPVTRRLLAALETHAREDAGPMALADWSTLASLFDRELQLITRLAAAAQEEGAANDPELRSRAAALRSRYDARGRRISQQQQELRAEQQALNGTRRRARAVTAAYSPRHSG